MVRLATVGFDGRAAADAGRTQRSTRRAAMTEARWESVEVMTPSVGGTQRAAARRQGAKSMY